jgi:spondin N
MGRMAGRFAVLSGALVLAACGGGSDTPAAPTPAPVTPAATPAPTARYSVTFEATWDAATHPGDFPPNPHFSGLIGGTHNASVSFWQPGGLASEGIRLMAERGRQSPLDLEVDAAARAGTAQHLLRGGDVPSSPGSVALEFDLSTGFPLVTLVTMVAPSPDWFVGVSGLSLLENGTWVQEKSVDLVPWDAGTDSGATYRAADRATAPPAGIHLLTGAPVEAGGRVAPMGRFVFRRLS